jgi:hypothetical protein
MGRPQKQTVDSFPHDAGESQGDTLTVLQSKYSNDGYAFWYKVREALCFSDGHFIDCRKPVPWQLLQTKALVNEQLATEMLGLMAELGDIDRELWSQKVIWSQNLVDRIAAVYKNRRKDIPCKPSIYRPKPESAGVSMRDNAITTGRNRQNANRPGTDALPSTDELKRSWNRQEA